MQNITAPDGKNYQRVTKWGFGQAFDPAYLPQGASGIGGVLNLDGECTWEATPTSLPPNCMPGSPYFVPVPYCYAFPLTGLAQTAAFIPTI